MPVTSAQFPFSGLTDGAGNATLLIGPIKGNLRWFGGIISCKVAGDGSKWSITQGGVPIFATGAQPTFGPLVVPTDQQVTLSLTGASPNVYFTATLIGYVSDHPDNLPPPQAIVNNVSIVGGSVAISGTPSVIISGTPTVQFAAGQSVAISGTPSVNIASGTVAISGTPNVNIQSQSVTVQQATPQSLIDTIAVVASGSKNETLVDPSHALGLALDGTFAGSLVVTVTGVTTGVKYGNVSLQTGGFILVPIFSKLDASVTLAWTLSGGAGGNLRVLGVQAAIYDIANGPLPPQSALSVIPADYNTIAVSLPGAGVLASVTLSASPSQRYRAHSIAAGIVQPTGTSGAVSPQLQDGASNLWATRLGVTGTFGQADHVDKEGCAYLGTVNTAMTLTCGNAVTGAFESVALGAYLV